MDIEKLEKWDEIAYRVLCSPNPASAGTSTTTATVQLMFFSNIDCLIARASHSPFFRLNQAPQLVFPLRSRELQAANLLEPEGQSTLCSQICSVRFIYGLPRPRTEPEPLAISPSGIRVAVDVVRLVPVMPLIEDETLGVRPRPPRTLPLDVPRAPLLAAASAA
jgi:hypothetical protein